MRREPRVRIDPDPVCSISLKKPLFRLQLNFFQNPYFGTVFAIQKGMAFGISINLM